MTTYNKDKRTQQGKSCTAPAAVEVTKVQEQNAACLTASETYACQLCK